MDSWRRLRRRGVQYNPILTLWKCCPWNSKQQPELSKAGAKRRFDIFLRSWPSQRKLSISLILPRIVEPFSLMNYGCTTTSRSMPWPWPHWWGQWQGCDLELAGWKKGTLIQGFFTCMQDIEEFYCQTEGRGQHPHHSWRESCCHLWFLFKFDW